MSWSYLLHGVFTGSELDSINAKLASHRRTSRRTKRELNRRLDELEDDLGRVTLLARSLADLCIEKGVLQNDELAACLRKVDLLDDEADDKLDPDALGG